MIPLESRKSVLVVDDDAAIRSMVRSVLLHEGFDVEEARSGNQAIARVSEKAFDAIVLDVMMNNGTGHDVLRKVATQRPDVKFIVVMSGSSPRNIETLDVANVEVTLRKPFDIEELIAAVRKAVMA